MHSTGGREREREREQCCCLQQLWSHCEAVRGGVRLATAAGGDARHGVVTAAADAQVRANHRGSWWNRGACSVCRYGDIPCSLSSDEKANRNVRDFGREIAHAVVSRRPPISLDKIVARTHMHTYAAKVWALSIVQGPFSVAPCQTLTSRFAYVLHRCVPPAVLAYILTAPLLTLLPQEHVRELRSQRAAHW